MAGSFDGLAETNIKCRELLGSSSDFNNIFAAAVESNSASLKITTLFVPVKDLKQSSYNNFLMVSTFQESLSTLSTRKKIWMISRK